MGALLLRRLAPAFLLVTLASCGDAPPEPSQRIRWSPDGQRAIVLPGDGLYVTDADGTLSPRLLPDVYDAAWVGDAERLVVGRRRVVNSWQTLATALGPDRARELAERAEKLWEAGAFFGKAPAPMPDSPAMLLYVHAHHADALRGRLGDGWMAPGASDQPSVTLTALAVARVTGAAAAIGAVLHEDMVGISQILPAPDGRVVAFVTSAFDLFVVPADGSAAPVEIDDDVGRFPAWSPDGRALVYITTEDEFISKVVWREVIDDVGRIEPGDDDERAFLLLSDSRVGCLPDGRVLFSSPDVHLPTTDESSGREDELFVLGPRAGTAVAPLTPLLPRSSRRDLPETIGGFELSPDATQLLVTGDGGTFVVDMSTGGVQPVLDASGSGFVAWRAPGEFTYVKAIGERRALMLRRGDDETELSCGWPKEVLDGLMK